MIARLPKGGDRPLRFVLAGAANTAFGITLYPLLLWTVPALQVHYMLALALSQAVCLCFAYSTYKFGVFHTRGNIAREFGAFSSFYLFNYVANWLALPVLVELGGISPIVAQLGFTALLIVGSYFWHSRISFRSRGEEA
jgi:putative flippase GtrA